MSKYNKLIKSHKLIQMEENFFKKYIYIYLTFIKTLLYYTTGMRTFRLIFTIYFCFYHLSNIPPLFLIIAHSLVSNEISVLITKQAQFQRRRCGRPKENRTSLHQQSLRHIVHGSRCRARQYQHNRTGRTIFHPMRVLLFSEWNLQKYKKQITQIFKL